MLKEYSSVNFLNYFVLAVLFFQASIVYIFQYFKGYVYQLSHILIMNNLCVDVSFCAVYCASQLCKTTVFVPALSKYEEVVCVYIQTATWKQDCNDDEQIFLLKG